MNFKEWLIKEETADKDRQLDIGSSAVEKPAANEKQLSRYAFMKKKAKK